MKWCRPRKRRSRESSSRSDGYSHTSTEAAISTSMGSVCVSTASCLKHPGCAHSSIRARGSRRSAPLPKWVGSERVTAAPSTDEPPGPEGRLPITRPSSPSHAGSGCLESTPRVAGRLPPVTPLTRLGRPIASRGAAISPSGSRPPRPRQSSACLGRRATPSALSSGRRTASAPPPAGRGIEGSGGPRRCCSGCRPCTR